MSAAVNAGVNSSANSFPASPSFWLAGQRPLSVPAILALVSAAPLWPSPWPAPPRAGAVRNRQSDDCRVHEG